MSVLLFMPTSGGSPLESIILTSHEDEHGDVGSSDTQEGTTSSNPHHRPQVVSRFDMENGIPVRKLSCDTAASWSEDEHEEGPISTGHGETVAESTSGTASANHIDVRKIAPGRSHSTGTSSKTSSSSSSSSRGRWHGNPRLSRSTSPSLHRDGEIGDDSTIDVHNGILV